MSKPHKRHYAPIEGESLTVQAPAKDADVNNIVHRHTRNMGRTLAGIAPGGTRQPMFGDFSGIDYHSMLNKVTEIDNAFHRLPAKIRSRFNNRPELLISFVDDPANLNEAVRMRLIDPPEGYSMTPEGNKVVQTDLTKPTEAPKPDPEANPHKTGGES